MWYRLVYKNGRHGAWTKDLKQTQEMAIFFNAKIEIKAEEDTKKKEKV